MCFPPLSRHYRCVSPRFLDIAAVFSPTFSKSPVCFPSTTSTLGALFASRPRGWPPRPSRHCRCVFPKVLALSTVFFDIASPGKHTGNVDDRPRAWSARAASACSSTLPVLSPIRLKWLDCTARDDWAGYVGKKHQQCRKSLQSSHMGPAPGPRGPPGCYQYHPPPAPYTAWTLPVWFFDFFGPLRRLARHCQLGKTHR